MSETEYTCNNCGHEGHNTRAVPDVPELVRYDWCRTRMMVEGGRGEYVRYDQAAAMLAAKDASIDLLESDHADVNQERARWKKRAEVAEAKLAAMEANK